MTPELSIVIPAYNEEGSLAEITRAVIHAAQTQDIGHEVLIVDDGSDDGTPAVARQLATEEPVVRVVTHDTNRGSGQAIRTGLEHARGEFVIYVPADGQFDLSELSEYLDPARDGADVVIGARIERSDYTTFRLLSSKVYLVLTNVLFGERFRDVNWVHLWRRSLFTELHVLARGVYFLDEVLVRASRSGRRIVEIDSRYLPRQAGQAKGSRISTILLTIAEMLRFWWDLNHNPQRRPSGQPSGRLPQSSARRTAV